MSDRPPASLPRKILTSIVLVVGGIVYGFFATANHWWIADRIHYTREAFVAVFEGLERPWYTSLPGEGKPIETLDADALMPGLVLLAGVNEAEKNFIKVIDRDGEVVTEVNPSWFDVWGSDTGQFPSARIPQVEPGTLLHGLRVVPNGDFIFNFEHLSTVRMNLCGEVVWKLDNLGHHFVDLGEDNTIWVGSERYIAEGETGYPNYIAPITDWKVQQLSMDGDILNEINIMDVLQVNELRGLLHLSTLLNDDTIVTGDILHLNDADIFPSDMDSDIFEPGDVLVSLRNINTVLVFDPETLKIKFRATGNFLRQHDADFAPGDKILVYDNNNLDPVTDPDLIFSRIVELDALTGEARTLFKGEGSAHFYSPTMGWQDVLDNGNLFVTSTREGRAFEVDPNGRLLWQYRNLVDDGFAAMVTEAHVLPQSMDREFFESRRATCTN